MVVFWKKGKMMSSLRTLILEQGIVPRKLRICVLESIHFFPRKDEIQTKGNKVLHWTKTQLKKGYDSVCAEYECICIYAIPMSARIGEYVTRLNKAYYDSKLAKSRKELFLFFLDNYINDNRVVTEKYGERIFIVTPQNYEFWVYAVNHIKMIKAENCWEQYRDREGVEPGEYLSDTVTPIKLTAEQFECGRKQIEKMGVRLPFVCFHSRTADYLKETSEGENSYHDYRDSSIQLIEASCQYLKEHDIMGVRMGKVVGDSITIENCLDYAWQYYSEFMDIWLTQNCKFYVGDCSGLFILPIMSHTPVLTKNITPLCQGGWGGFPRDGINLFMTKKIRNLKTGRILSFKQQFEIEKECGCYGSHYKSLGYEWIENTEEEILDAVKEMNERIDGIWIDTEKDLELQRKFQELFEEGLSNNGIAYHRTPPGKISTSFLRRNKFMLD